MHIKTSIIAYWGDKMIKFNIEASFLRAILLVMAVDSESTLTLLPSEAGLVRVCPGRELILTCSTNRAFLEWNIRPSFTIPGTPYRTRLISSNDGGHDPIVLSMVSFNFQSAITVQTSASLVSVISVDNVQLNLSGTKVNCTDIGAQSPPETSTKIVTIHVINNDLANSNSLEVETEVFNYGIDDVTVTLSWIPQENGTYYNISIVPQVDSTLTPGSDNVMLQLTVSYNIGYVVSIVSILCGRNVSSIAINLHYVKCDSLLRQFESESSTIQLTNGYSDPALEGIRITLECSSPSLVFSGPHNETSCMGNGEWEPDPRQLKCVADCGVPMLDINLNLTYNSTLEGSVALISCDEYNATVTALCHKSGSWIPHLNTCDDIILLLTSTDIKNLGSTMIPLPVKIITSISTSIAIILLIIVGISILAIVVIMKTKSGFYRKKKMLVTAVGEGHIIEEQVLKPQQMRENESQSEYSVLQHPKPFIRAKQTSMDAHLTNKKMGENQSEYSLLDHPVQREPMEQISSKDTQPGYQSQSTLVYADIGPLSIKKQSCITTTPHQDDQAVEYSQINFKAKKNKPQIPGKKENGMNNYPLADTLLNLDSLLIQLQPEVTHKWYEFGEAVGMDKEMLNKYREYPDDQCIIEVLDFWLRIHTGQPTWRELAEILRKIELQRLAHDIERVYETGKLPVEVNMNEINTAELGHADSEESPPPIPPRCSEKN